MNTPILPEAHKSERVGWLRAAVLGANDGIVSTASLVVGVAAAHAGRSDIVVAGVAGLVAGALSMAAGEYVSVSSQADTERADLARERRELATEPEAEESELAAIYVGRGLDPALARTVARQLMAHDALGAHASALTFAVGAALPLVAALLAPPDGLIGLVAGASLICLATLGALAARAGGASPWRGAWRVAFWGALAMGVTAAVGALFGQRVA
jgi:VIT1/CCC1 family predicted Fe2+/Mn2+ transporter